MAINSHYSGPHTAGDYWSNKPISCFKGAPCHLGDLMSRNRFEAILCSLRYTNIDCPIFQDSFCEVCQMMMEWNSNMLKVFVLLCISCLDESILNWTNMYSFPGFMFAPRKPWPLGNEWHSICCAISGVMYAIELVDRKDHPHQMGAKVLLATQIAS